jgi:hypothetical protein
MGSKPSSNTGGGSVNTGNNNNGNNSNDVSDPKPSGSSTVTVTPTDTPTDTPTPSSSDGGEGVWISIDGYKYSTLDDGALHDLSFYEGNIDGCGNIVKYEKVQSSVTTRMWYVHIYSKNSNTHLFTIILGYGADLT